MKKIIILFIVFLLSGVIYFVSAATKAPVEPLKITTNSVYGNQTVNPPQTNFKIADFNLKNNSEKDINLDNIKVDLNINNSFFSSYITNLYVVYGDNNKTSIASIAEKSNNFSIKYVLPAGKSTSLSVYGNISSYMSLDFFVQASMSVNGLTSVGQKISFGKASITAEKNSSASLYSKMVVANQKVVAGVLQFKTVNDSYKVTQLKFIVPNQNISRIIKSAYLTNAETKEIISNNVNVIFDGVNYILDFQNNITIDLNSVKIIAINYDLNSSINSNSSNINISPTLIYAKVIDSRGNNFDGSAKNYYNYNYYGGIKITDNGLSLNPIYAFKSLPTFSSALTKTGLVLDKGVGELYKLKITADKNGDIAIKQINFIVKINDTDTSNPRLKLFKLYKDEKDYTNSVTIGTVINNKYIELENTGMIGIGIDNKVAVYFDNEEVIPAGQSKIYTLKATPVSFNKAKKGADSIVTYTESDKNYIIGGSYLYPIFWNIYFGLSKDKLTSNYTEHNLLWSDKSSDFPNIHNNFASMYTVDWYNGYSISGLPLGKQTLNAK